MTPVLGAGWGCGAATFVESRQRRLCFTDRSIVWSHPPKWPLSGKRCRTSLLWRSNAIVAAVPAATIGCTRIHGSIAKGRVSSWLTNVLVGVGLRSLCRIAFQKVSLPWVISTFDASAPEHSVYLRRIRVRGCESFSFPSYLSRQPRLRCASDASSPIAAAIEEV